MVKLTVLYGTPPDTKAFENYYLNTHLPIAQTMQGVRRIELAKVVGAPDGSASPFHRIAELYFDDSNHMKTVMATPEAQRTVADIGNFATGGVTVFSSEVD